MRRSRLEPVVSSIREFDFTSGLLTDDSFRELLLMQSPMQEPPRSNSHPSQSDLDEKGLANSAPTDNSPTSNAFVPTTSQEPAAVPPVDSNTAPIKIASELTVPTIPDSMVRGVSFLEPFQDEETKDKPAEDETDKQDKSDSEQQKSESDSMSLKTQTVEDLEKKIKDQKELLNADETIEPTTKTEKLKQLSIAEAAVKRAAGFKAEIKKRNQETDEEFEKIKKKKEEALQETREPKVPDMSKSSSDLQMSLQELRRQLQAKKDERSLNEAQSIARDQRVKELPGLRTKVADSLKDIKLDKADAKKNPDDSASNLVQEARELEKQKELESLNLEPKRLDRLGVLLPIDHETINLDIKKLEAEVAAYERAFNEKRDEEIQEQQTAALRAARMADPALKKLAEKNQELVATRAALTADTLRCEEKTKAAEKSIEEVDKKLMEVQSRIDTVSGTANASGVELVDFRQSLMYTFESQAEIGIINKKTQALSLKLLSLKEDRNKLADSDSLIEQLYQEHEEAKSDKDREAANSWSNEKREKDKDNFKKNASDLIATQIKYLSELEADYKKFRTCLDNEKEKLLKLVKDVQQAREYIDEKALWLRSASPVSLWGPLSQKNKRLPGDIEKSWDATSRLLDRSKWTEFTSEFWNSVSRRPYESAFAAIFLAGLFVVTKRLKRQL